MAGMTYDDGINSPTELSVLNLRKSVTTKKPVVTVQEIGITEEAVLLGDTGGAGYGIFKHLDPTNFHALKVAPGGLIFARLDPDTDQDGKGGVALLKLGSGMTAPTAIAYTAACRMATMVCPP